MGFVDTSVAGDRSKDDRDDQIAVSRLVGLLIDQHHHDADIIAARRADCLFRDGNVTEG